MIPDPRESLNGWPINGHDQLVMSIRLTGISQTASSMLSI